MPPTLSPCHPSDAPALAALNLAAFSPAPHFKATYPPHLIPPATHLAYKTSAYEKLIRASRQEPPTPPGEPAQQRLFCLKATDPATGAIMAFAVWGYWEGGYTREGDGHARPPERGWPEGANALLLGELCRQVGESRAGDKARGGGHWLLNALATHPQYERQGAAGMLVRWPFEHADREGKKCFLESTAAGYHFYHKHGFVDTGEVFVDLDAFGEHEGGLGVARWVTMVREPEGL